MFNRQKYLYIFWLIILVSTISAQSTEYFYHKNPGNSTEGDAVELSIMLLKDQPVSQGSIFFRPIGELSYQEISDILQIPISTVGVRIKRGKEKIKSLCKDEKYEV